MNKKNDDKQFDILLKRAFEEYVSREDEILPDEEKLRVEFPPSEEKRLEYAEAVRKKSRSAATKNFMKVATIVIAATALAFATLMMDENVRAAIAGSFVSENEENGMKISFRGPNEASDPTKAADVTVGYIPEGMVLEEQGDENFPHVRVIYISLPEHEAETSFVKIKVIPSLEYDGGVSEKTLENLYQSSVNGMDAYRVDINAEVGGKMIESGFILFGDRDVTIEMYGHNINREELIRIAENIRW